MPTLSLCQDFDDDATHCTNPPSLSLFPDVNYAVTVPIATPTTAMTATNVVAAYATSNKLAIAIPAKVASAAFGSTVVDEEFIQQCQGCEMIFVTTSKCHR